VLGDVCVFDHIEAETFRQESTTMFTFYAWMANPDLLPRAKTVTFFSERAGRSSASQHLTALPTDWGGCGPTHPFGSLLRLDSAAADGELLQLRCQWAVGFFVRLVAGKALSVLQEIRLDRGGA
jgi:hypothetical protein